ncbi:MAG: DUF1559 domain-containing protein [Candidatus Hydrogenedentes bacterium]|nr:DUF1559 domain-containing protein [Candidatus Hydrogenedentota bacterium]
MTDRNDMKRIEELVRGYLLGTLDERERARVEKDLASDEWKVVFDRERDRIALFDRSLTGAPPAGLAQRTIERVHREIAAPARPARSMNVWALVGSIVVIALVSALVLPSYSRAREASRRASCQNNLKQIGIIFKMYAGDHGGKWPALGPYKDVWMFDIPSLYPEYMSDLNVLICPTNPDGESIAKRMTEALAQSPPDFASIARDAARSYTYMGWALRNKSELTAVTDALARDWDGARNGGVDTPTGPAPRLNEDVAPAEAPATPISEDEARRQSTVPVMFDTVIPRQLAVHLPDGGNVLYQDGHVEFMRQGDTFPMSQRTEELLHPTPP